MITSNNLILCHRLLLLPSIFPSIRVFSSESALSIGGGQWGWPKYWSFSFDINPSNEYSGLISFKIDWFELLAAPRTLKSPLHSLLGFSVHGILQAKILEWVAIPFYRGSF